MAKPKTWDHPSLGAWRYEDGVWAGRVEAPAWAVYKAYKDDEEVAGETTVEVQVHAPDAAPPSDAQAQAVLDFVNHSDALAPAVADAVWSDINGDGPGSKHWWQGDLEQVNENAELFGEPLENLDDLRESLILSSVGVGYQHETAVEVRFSPDWEEEHGVGVLVRDGRVIGLGYQLDVEPFDDKEPWPPREGPPVLNPFTGQLIDPKEKNPTEE